MHLYYDDLVGASATEAAEVFAQQLLPILTEKAYTEMHYKYQDDLRETVDPFEEDVIYNQMVNEACEILDTFIQRL